MRLPWEKWTVSFNQFLFPFLSGFIFFLYNKTFTLCEMTYRLLPFWQVFPPLIINLNMIIMGSLDAVLNLPGSRQKQDKLSPELKNGKLKCILVVNFKIKVRNQYWAFVILIPGFNPGGIQRRKWCQNELWWIRHNSKRGRIRPLLFLLFNSPEFVIIKF